MLEFLNKIDTALLLLINGCHNSFFDVVMYQISNTYIWIPLYLILIALIIKHFKKRSIIILLIIILLVVICDQVSSGILKVLFQRLRPSHEPALEGMLHFVNDYQGGKYGFVSSHAANTFGVATFISLLFYDKYKLIAWLMFAWAIVVSYSRIYLGVHYPADIIGGATLGILVGYGIFAGMKRMRWAANKL